MINSRVVIWLVTSHCVSRALLSDQRAILRRRGGRIGSARFHRSAARSIRDKSSADRASSPGSPKAGNALRDTLRSDDWHCDLGEKNRR